MGWRNKKTMAYWQKVVFTKDTNSAGRIYTPGNFDTTQRNTKLSKFCVMVVGRSMVTAVMRDLNE